MKFRPIRAIMFGILLWLLTFLTMILLMFCFGLIPPDCIYYIVYFILVTLFSLLVSAAYLKPRYIKGGFGHGILLGVVFVIIMVILDVFITVPFFAYGDYGYLTRVDILAGELIVLMIAALMGYGLRKEDVREK